MEYPSKSRTFEHFAFRSSNTFVVTFSSLRNMHSPANILLPSGSTATTSISVSLFQYEPVFVYPSNSQAAISRHTSSNLKLTKASSKRVRKFSMAADVYPLSRYSL